MRSPAREAGGALASGPTTEGGWEVSAVLPCRVAAASVRRSVPWRYRLAEVTAAAGLVVQPLLSLLVVRTESVSSGPGASAGVLFALPAAGQTLALLWRRRAPRAAQGVVYGLVLLRPVATAVGEYTGWVLLPPAEHGRHLRGGRLGLAHPNPPHSPA